jgi:ribosome-associated protein
MPKAKKNKTHSHINSKDKAALIAGWLVERKAADIKALDVSTMSSIADVFLIASATSIRHAQGLADHVLQGAGEHDLEFLNMEGHANGQWILMDLNDVLVHIFHEDSREFYDLEGMWSKALRLDLGLEEADSGTQDAADAADGADGEDGP